MAININPQPLHPGAYHDMAAGIGQQFVAGQQQGMQNALVQQEVARDAATRNALAQYFDAPEEQRGAMLNTLAAQSPELAGQVLSLQQMQNELAMQERREQALKEYTAAEHVLRSESPALALRLLDEDGAFLQQLTDAGLIDPEDGISDDEARMIAQWARDTTASIAGIQLAEPEAPESPFGKIDVAEFTPESVAAFQASGDYSALRRVEPEAPAESTALEAKLRTVRTALGRELNEAEILRAAGMEPSEAKDMDSEPIPATQIPNVRLPDGSSPEIGTTWGQARQAGARVYSAADLARQENVERAVHTLDRLEDMALGENGVFVDNGGSILTNNVLARFANGIANGMGSLVGTEDAQRRAVFDSTSRGVLASLVRSLGESGALSDGDMQRALELIPTLGAVPTTERQARMQFGELRTLLTRGAEQAQQMSGEGGGQTIAGVTVEWID